MPFTLSNASVDAFTITLTALSGILDKAAAHAAARKIDPAVLLATRLYPDMFAFTRQVQIATDQAKNGTSRLAGVEPPRFEDNETTIEQIKDRLARTIAHLTSFAWCYLILTAILFLAERARLMEHLRVGLLGRPVVADASSTSPAEKRP